MTFIKCLKDLYSLYLIISCSQILVSLEESIKVSRPNISANITNTLSILDGLASEDTFIGEGLFRTDREQFSKGRARPSHHTEPTLVNFNLPKLINESRERHLFRIGLIVPKTAFVSLYKTYTQRVKDTFAHLLQLSRHKRGAVPRPPDQGGRSARSAGRATLPYSSQQAYDSNKQQTQAQSSSCLSRESPSFQKSRRLSWRNLTFNQHFDIEVVNLVNLAPRSSAREIIDSMCQKLIEQNVSVIIYLENNQDHDISALESQAAYQATTTQSSRFANTRSQMLNAGVKERENSPFRFQLNASRNDKTSGGGGSVPADLVRAEINQSVAFPVGGGGSNEVQQTSSQAHFIMHLAHAAGIPMIAWSMTAALAQRPKTRRTLHLAPTVAHQAKAMLAIMDRYSWYSFSIVTTTLVGYEDFILAFKQSIAAQSIEAPVSQSGSSSPALKSTSTSNIIESSMSSTLAFDHSNGNNTVGADKLFGRSQAPEVAATTQPGTNKAFRLVDIVKIKRRTLEHIEDELRKLTFSESRIVLLYSTKGEAMDILKVARKLRLTKRSYAWIVAQSVIGPDESEEAPAEFYPGLLGIYFRSNHERLLDELSRAITIIAHGLERFVRDEQQSSPVHEEQESSKAGDPINEPFVTSTSSDDEETRPKSGDSTNSITTDTNQARTLSMITGSGARIEHSKKADSLASMIDYRKKLLSVHSRCQGGPNPLSEERGDLLYEYFRRSSPSNEFDADGSLKDVELNVMNLDNERQWRKIGCFLDETLTIDDITWPEQAERPPSGTMEKFHLRAVFLEEPSFVNLADPDTETGECKTNRAVRCKYKTSQSLESTAGQDIERNQSNDAHNKYNSTSLGEFEYKCCSGFSIDLMEKFATDLKFTYDLYRVPDGMWGVHENNTWNGLIEEVSKGRADVVITIKINSERQNAVDFSIPFLDTGISILVSKQTGVISKLAFLEPFDRLAWIMFICVGIPLAATSIFCFELLSPNGFYSRKYQSKYASEAGDASSRDHYKFSFCRTLWLVITILFGSSAPINSPFGYTARFMSNVWATFAVVFLAVYTANLAAFMITREEYLALSGINDPKLAFPFNRHPPLRFGTIAGGNTHAVLRANKPNLYEYMRKFNRFSIEDGVEAVKTGQLDAFIYDSLVLEYMAGQDPDCKLLTVGSIYSTTGFSLAFPRNSRYYEKFNMKMLEYKKNGELDRLRRFWQQGLCKPGQNRHSISKPLDLSQFMSAFLLLGAGILCSIFILACEHLYAIYLRDILIRSRYRTRLTKLLYPFSMSLADSLRLPSDPAFGDEHRKREGRTDSASLEQATLELNDANCPKKPHAMDNIEICNSSNAIPPSIAPANCTAELELIQTLKSYKVYLDKVNRGNNDNRDIQHMKELMFKLELALRDVSTRKDATSIKIESVSNDNTVIRMQSPGLVTCDKTCLAKLHRSKTRPSIRELLNRGLGKKRTGSSPYLSSSNDPEIQLWSSSQPERLVMSSCVTRDKDNKQRTRRMWFSGPRRGSDQNGDETRAKSSRIESANPSAGESGGNTEILL